MCRWRAGGARGHDCRCCLLPDAVLLSLLGISLLLPLPPGWQKPPGAHYSLLPAFYDGLLEAMPAGTPDRRLRICVPFKDGEFLKGYQQIHREALKLSAVPDRYREKVKAGFGLWLDYRRQLTHFTPEEFQQALHSALRSVMGCVDLYRRSAILSPCGSRILCRSYCNGAAPGEVVRMHILIITGIFPPDIGGRPPMSPR